MDTSKIFERIDELNDEFVEFWQKLCDIESPSSYKEGVDAVGKCVMDKARARGWQIKIHKEEVSGDAISIIMNPEAKGAPVCFSGHMDTVHPVGSFGTHPTRIEGDKMFGPGVTDCKGGIVTAFLTMAALEDCGFCARPLKLILQSDEEVGSAPSEKRTVKFMAEEGKDAIAFFNCESYGITGEKVVVARKGIIRYQFDVTGRAEHSASCYNGANAIAEAAHKILELEKWKDEAGITCNCGVITGGTTANTVAASCTFYADIRYKTMAELEAVKQRVKEIADTVYIPGCKTELSQKSYRVSMELKERNVALAEKMNEIFRNNGMSELKISEVNGGSDAADMTYYGIPCVDSLGVRGGYIHSRDEYGFISSLALGAKRLALVTALL